jgi:hypothetical protein
LLDKPLFFSQSFLQFRLFFIFSLPPTLFFSIFLSYSMFLSISVSLLLLVTLFPHLFMLSFLFCFICYILGPIISYFYVLIIISVSVQFYISVNCFWDPLALGTILLGAGPSSLLSGCWHASKETLCSSRFRVHEFHTVARCITHDSLIVVSDAIVLVLLCNSFWCNLLNSKYSCGYQCYSIFRFLHDYLC